MQINNNNSTNFNGYKNILTNRIMTGKNENFSFLSMQLNNIGHKDLDIWKNAQKNLLNINNPSDTFTIELVKGFGHNTLASGDKCLTPKILNKSPETEKLMLKTYTWMANLTKRIMNDNHLIEDTKNKQLEKVIKDTTDNLYPIFGRNYYLAIDFVSSAFQKIYHPQEVALDINKSIDEIMHNYLFKE